MNPEVTQVLSLSEALASFRHTYLGSLFLDPEDVLAIPKGRLGN